MKTISALFAAFIDNVFETNFRDYPKFMTFELFTAALDAYQDGVHAMGADYRTPSSRTLKTLYELYMGEIAARGVELGCDDEYFGAVDMATA